LPAKLTISVPCDDPIVAIHSVERERKAINDGFYEAALRFSFGCAALHLYGERCGRPSRGLIERCDVRGERGLLCSGVNKTRLCLPAICGMIEAYDDQALSTTAKAQRRGILNAMLVITQQECRAIIKQNGG